VRKEQDLFRSLALEARAHDFADLRRRVLHSVRPLARIHKLDLAAQRAQPPGDQLGGAIQAFEVAAPVSIETSSFSVSRNAGFSF